MKCITTEEHDENERIEWQEWKTIKEKRTIKKDKEEKVKGISITKKTTQDGMIKELKENFHLAVKKYKAHQYNIQFPIPVQAFTEGHSLQGCSKVA